MTDRCAVVGCKRPPVDVPRRDFLCAEHRRQAGDSLKRPQDQPVD